MTNFEYLEKHYGLNQFDWALLRKAERNLTAWAEDHCNYCRSSVDETKWLNLAAVTVDKLGLSIYHQQDCRGCSLYVYKPSDLAGQNYPIEQVYNRYGTACC